MCTVRVLPWSPTLRLLLCKMLKVCVPYYTRGNFIIDVIIIIIVMIVIFPYIYIYCRGQKCLHRQKMYTPCIPTKIEHAVTRKLCCLPNWPLLLHRIWRLLTPVKNGLPCFRNKPNYAAPNETIRP